METLCKIILICESRPHSPCFHKRNAIRVKIVSFIENTQVSATAALRAPVQEAGSVSPSLSEGCLRLLQESEPVAGYSCRALGHTRRRTAAVLYYAVAFST